MDVKMSRGYRPLSLNLTSRSLKVSRRRRKETEAFYEGLEEVKGRRNGRNRMG